MTIAVTIKDGSLQVWGKVVLTGVPGNLVVSPAAPGGEDSAFLGATSTIPSSRHVFSLGVLQGFRFLCLFRFKIWWMIPRVGKTGSEIPIETQMLLLEAAEESALQDDLSSETPSTGGKTFYILLLPVLDGQFRSSLQGSSANELQLCIESGDASVQTSQALEAVFVNSGNNPFELLKDSVMILAKHKGTFSHIENKRIPPHLDWFGWCTWDAFYSGVSPQGIKEGLKRFAEGRCSPKFLIIDDGWQETVNEFQKEGEPQSEGTQFATRLVDIKENSKFRSPDSQGSSTDLGDFISSIKESYGVKYVYVWHALAGYWGGVLPLSESMKKYNPKLEYPIQSPGNLGNLRDIAMDSLEKYGVGVIDPVKISDFYNDLHSYLASNNVDGVKVDVQNLIETLGSGHGGRVTLTRQFQEALEQSVARNFKDNNLICSMSHNSDSIYSSKNSAVARASEDFMPREKLLQTLHVASVAYNSLLLGEIMVPDWDMFHSKHYAAEFHASARALGGGAVYVSDELGNHDFKILQKLVLPNGAILRAKHAGCPTRDCLFRDPVMDGKCLLKIWNLNKCSGVIGVFNCQGAGSWPMKPVSEEKAGAAPTTLSLSGTIKPEDVEFLEEVAGKPWNGDCAVYAFNASSLSVVPKDGHLEVTVATLECEIYTISPIKVFRDNIHFAAIGLLDMYNSGGAIEAVDYTMDASSYRVTVKVRGCGRIGFYSSTRPKSCMVEMKGKDFAYNVDDGLLIVNIHDACKIWNIQFMY